MTNSVESRVGEYKSINVSQDEQLLLANAVAEVRWGSEEDTPVNPANLLSVNRWQDRGSDLWRVSNTLQENVIQGGVRGRSKTGRRLHTRAVTGVNENVRLNRAIWSITDHFAKQKLAA